MASTEEKSTQEASAIARAQEDDGNEEHGESGDDHDDLKDETAQFKPKKGKSSFKVFPIKPDDVFKPEFLKRLADVESVNCGVFMPIGNRAGTPTEFIGLRLIFNEVSKRDAALDVYLPEVNDNTNKSGLRRQVWSYPFRGVDSCAAEDKKLMLYVPRLPLDTSASAIKALFPTADEIEFPVDESGNNLSYAMIKYKTTEELNVAYEKEDGYSIGDITLSVQKIGRGNKRRNQRQRNQRGKRESPQAQKLVSPSEQTKPDMDQQSSKKSRNPRWNDGSAGQQKSSSGGDQNINAMTMMAMQQHMELQMLQIKQQIQLDMQRQMSNMMGGQGMLGGGNFGHGNSNYSAAMGQSPGDMGSVGGFNMGINGQGAGPSKSKKKRRKRFKNRTQSPLGADNFAFEPRGDTLKDRPFNTSS